MLVENSNLILSSESNEFIEQKRMLWRCRRGTKELDLILTRFVAECYADLKETEKEEFNLLLETQDPVLTEWLCFDAQPTSNLQEIVETIRDFGRENSSD